jgi:hypothetical protein
VSALRQVSRNNAIPLLDHVLTYACASVALHAGKLGSLVGQEQVALHMYRWVASDTATTGSTGASGCKDTAMADAQGAAVQPPQPPQPPRPQQPPPDTEPEQEDPAAVLLGGLAGLGVLLMGPMPEGLPPCELHLAVPGVPGRPRLVQVGEALDLHRLADHVARARLTPQRPLAIEMLCSGSFIRARGPVPREGFVCQAMLPDSRRAAAPTSLAPARLAHFGMLARSLTSSQGPCPPPDTPQVHLAPAGQTTFSAQQFASLLACHGVLLRHMFSKGSYCSAAADPEVMAARCRRQQGQQQGGEAAPRAAAPPPESSLPAGSTAGAGGAAGTGDTAAGGGEGYGGVGPGRGPPKPSKAEPDPVHELVSRIMNRLVLLHDQVPLVERKEEVAAPDPEDTPFLLVPCLTGKRTYPLADSDILKFQVGVPSGLQRVQQGMEWGICIWCQCMRDVHKHAHVMVCKGELEATSCRTCWPSQPRHAVQPGPPV